MSLTPIFNEWWDDIEHEKSLDQYFRSPVEHEIHDTKDQLNYPFLRRHRNRHHSLHPYHYALMTKRHRGSSVVQRNNDNFVVSFDVQHFGPNEISVKVVGKDAVVVEAKHEEMQDEHGWISRRFVRRLVIPEEFEVDRVETFLSNDGVLMITAPRKKEDCHGERERIIPIQFTGAVAVGEKNQGGEENGERPMESVEQEDNKISAARRSGE